MRFHAAAVLILLSESAVATPSVPNTHRAVANTYRPPPVTRPAHIPETASSRWRRVSDRIIERVWGTKKHSDCDKLPTKTAERKKRPASPQTQPATLPAHTLARYGGDVLLRFNISTAVEAKSLADAADTLLLDVWEFAHDWLDVRLAKELVPSLLGLLPQSLQHSHRPLLRERELAQAIFDTYPTPPREQKQDGPASYEPQHHQQQQRPLLHSSEVRATGAETNIFFSDYQPLSVITPWLRLLSSLFTTHVRLLSIGTSSEGRDIPALRIGVHPTNAETPLPKRKTVLLTAGLHAREWIATSTSLYIAYTLITSYGKNAQITKLLEDFDFVVIPTLNPDGYEYTWSTDRLWRKTRQSTSLRFCAGMDLDHSFNYSFPVGSAGNPCSEAYAGESAFQAVESRALADWALNQTSTREFVGLLDLHSYSQQILYPYSYSCAASPPGLEDLEELAYGLEKAIRLAHGGHVYEVLQACEGNTVAAAASASASASSTPSSSSSSSSKKEILPRMESSGGSLLDYFYATLRVRYAYQIKLRDRGTYGFLLPRENIVPTGREMVDAVLYFGSFLSDLYAAAAAAAGDEAASSVVVVEEEEEVKEPAAGDELTAAVDEAEEPWVMVEDLGGVEDGQEVQYELRRMRRRR